MKMNWDNIDFDEVMESAAADCNEGFCIQCGNQQSGCEPDARKYECESCGENAVYGAEELLMMI